MIKMESLIVQKSRKIAVDTIEMTLESGFLSNQSKPGQFLHIHIPNHTLRRPISIASIDRDSHSVVIIFKIIGSGTKYLSTLIPGQKVQALGPNGNGFEVDDEVNAKTILLVGGGVGIPPLHYLGKVLAHKNINIISVLGFQRKENVFYEEKFNEFSETHMVTNDGSLGHKGYVTDLITKVGHFDRYYTCGPFPMLQAVTKKLANKPGFISFEERMGCGIGACFACVISTNDQGGYRKICQDGPVFSTDEVMI